MSLRWVAIGCSVFVFLIIGLTVCRAGEWSNYEIIRDTIWDPSQNPIVLMRDLTVHSVNPNDPSDRIKLTIEPGVVVKLASHVDIFVDGDVIAEEALFTSINDDSTPDGAWEDSTGSPQVGDWNSIYIFNHNATFSGCTFRYGKSIEIDDCSPRLYGNRIEKFSRYGFFIIARDTLVSPVIECNKIFDIGEPYIDDNPQNGKFDPGREAYQDFDMNDQYDAGVAIYCYTPTSSFGPCVPLIQYNQITMSTDPAVDRGGLPIVFENTLPVMLDVGGVPQNPIPDGNLIRQRSNDNRFVSAIGIKGYIKPGELNAETGDYNYVDYFLPLVDDRAVASGQVSPVNQHLPYVVLEDLVIAAGCDLAVPPNGVLKFCEDTSLEIRGTVQTSDSSSSRSYFTSLQNDASGLRVPGSSSAPSPGDWYQFRICCDDCLIENSNFSYGTLVKIDQCSPTFINNTITDYYLYGLYIYAEAQPARPEVSRVVIQDCGHVVDAANGIYEGGGICLETGRDYLGPCEPTLQDNRIMSSEGYPLTLLGTCDPVYINNTLMGNSYRAVAIGGTIRGRGATWDDVTGYHFPYVVIDPVVIAGGYRSYGLSTSLISSDPLDGVFDTLVDKTADWKENVLTGSMLQPNTERQEQFEIVSNTRTSILVGSDMSGVAKSGDPYEFVVSDTIVEIPLGTIIKLAKDMSIYVKGRLILNGTTRDRIYFTSFNDDTAAAGGSVLLSGSTPMPQPGDWEYFKIENDNNKIEECVFKYGTAIYVDSCSPLIQHCSIALFSSAGVHCYAHSGKASPYILNNAIMCNRNGVLCETDPGFSDPHGATPMIHSNDIVNNEEFGVVNLQEGAVIDAVLNWWGAVSGPAGIGSGSGDYVNEGVVFQPFQDEANFEVDTAPPAFSDVFPAPYSVDVDTSTIIMLTVTDVGKGVDTNSVSIRVDHDNGGGFAYVMKDGEDLRYNGGYVAREDVAKGYRYRYVPGQAFAAGRQICVKMHVSDLELCPNSGEYSFCFWTGRNIGLSFGRVEPEIGTTRTQFTYSVDFFDRDLAAPASARVYIDNLPRNMTLVAGDPWGGTYSYATSLKVGYHTFYFRFEGGGGAGTVWLPEQGEVPPYFYGPTVLSEERAENWPMFRHDPNHSGSSPVVATSAPMLNWSFIAGGFVISSPVVDAENTVYFGCYDGNVYAINTDGTVKWAVSTGDYVASTPALAEDGSLYIGSGDHYFYSFDHEGALNWSYKTGGVVDSSPVIGIDGNIYFGCNDSYLYSMTPEGELRWRFNTGSWVTSSPAIWFDGTVFFGSDDRNLYAVRHDGNLRWSYNTGDVITSSPVVGPDETVYLGAGYQILAVNSNGTLKWRVGADNVVHSSPALSQDGVLYVGSYDHKLYSLDADTGTINWTYAANNIIHTSPAIDGNGNVLFGSHDGNLYCVGKDGTLKWRFYDPVRPGYGFDVHSSPAIGPDGSVYFGSEEKLYALKELPAYNTAPTLSDATYRPSGKGLTRYEFKIHYFDKELEPPSVAKVVVDDAAYALSHSSGEAANGYYATTIMLTPGQHSHYYFFADGASKTATYPAVGAIDGPFIEEGPQGTTPSARSVPPIVWMAGYFGSHISARLGGKLHVVAYCTDPDDDIARVDLCYKGEPLVPLLDDGQSQDGLAGDGIYACFREVAPGPALQARLYLLEVIATDADGNMSNVWPYVTVDDYPQLDLPGFRSLTGGSTSLGGVSGIGSSSAMVGAQPPAPRLSLNLQNYILDSIRGVSSRSVGPEPEILLAGFGNCRINQDGGGTVFLNAIVNDPDGLSDITLVEAKKSVYNEGDFGFENVELDSLTGDGQRAYYGAICRIAGGERGHHLIEIQALDENGNRSTFFPYLTVVE
ncbi:MAG: PQQ-binding-like beta-propeller repeat protein [Candidatus Coatesbacteria bacterium]|nr:PQQ-binding-like beta-propeller repeat protein [Candidatus Coatesbacteria bacterium]